jgi:hypothetical protein
MVGEPGGGAPIARPEDVELQVPLNQQQQQPPTLPLDGHEPPGTPAISTFEVDDEFNLPISVAIVILLIYIFVGAIIYWTWENWGFFESFYFVFISMSTIGFGDFVPQVRLVIVPLVLTGPSPLRTHTQNRVIITNAQVTIATSCRALRKLRNRSDLMYRVYSQSTDNILMSTC